MQLLLFVLLSAVGVVATMPTEVLKAEKLLYNLLERVLSVNDEARSEGEDRETGTIPKMAKDLGLTTFLEYMEEAKLEETISTKNPLTVMAPTNEAFSNLPTWFANLFKQKKPLEHIMKYHVMEEKITPSEMKKNDMLVPTMMGGEAKIRFNNYLDGKVITASGRPIKMMEHEATNGILYELEKVMMPPSGPTGTSLTLCPAYKTLTMALKKANMEEKLNGEGPYTMFAPTDKAFEKIPKETLDMLMKNTTALEELLMYHIVPGTYYSAGWTDGDEMKTECGKMLKISMDDETFKVNTVPITSRDIPTTNGCVHAVESVLMPPTVRLELVF